MKCQNKGCPRDTVLWSVFLECEEGCALGRSNLCDHRAVVQKHCHVDWSKGRQNHLCVHSSKAVHHHVLHLDVFFVEVPFISALRTNSDLCLCGCVIFLPLYPTGLFLFLLVLHFPDPLFFQPSLNSEFVSFFPLLLRKSKAVPLMGASHTSWLSLPNCRLVLVLTKFRFVIWTVCCIWKKTYLSVWMQTVELYTQPPVGFPQRKQAEEWGFFSRESYSFQQQEILFCFSLKGKLLSVGSLSWLRVTWFFNLYIQECI